MNWTRKVNPVNADKINQRILDRDFTFGFLPASTLRFLSLSPVASTKSITPSNLSNLSIKFQNQPLPLNLTDCPRPDR